MRGHKSICRQKEEKELIYAELFLAFLQIGAFSFGGGYAAMPLIQEQVIEKYGWLTISEFTDLITIAEMTPGPIAVNSATFVGIQVAGIPGAIVATLGVIFPSCVIVTILAILYKKFRTMTLMQTVLQSLRPAVVSMIFSAGLVILISVLFASNQVSFANGNFQIRPFLYFLLAIFAIKKRKMDPIRVMVGTGILELLCQVILRVIAG